MTAADIEPAVVAILADDWGDRRSWFEFAVGHPGCQVVVAEADGEVVGTGVATINGTAGWIGTIWVATAWRGRGLGRRLTEATIDLAEAAGCRTLILVATDAGRPLYERLGFEVRTWHHILEAPGRVSGDGPRSGSEPPPRPIRPFGPPDLAPMARLDAAATGEDRAHLLGAFASPTTTKVALSPTGEVAGFLIRPPWGGGATIAPTIDAAVALLEGRRDGYPADRKVRCGILEQNPAGLAHLTGLGWTEAWRAPRLERGPQLDWEPTAIWGQFNHAMG
jgi:GNAT superfamily N-acetyltransferase